MLRSKAQPRLTFQHILVTKSVLRRLTGMLGGANPLRSCTQGEAFPRPVVPVCGVKRAAWMGTDARVLFEVYG